MAGDWIKFETATPDKPEVWAIADTLGIDPDAVVGKLLRVWIWFDQHTENGTNAPSVSKLTLDRLVGVREFANTMVLHGWMVEKNGEISLPHFERHNGKTAKNRALTAKRVAKYTANAKLTQGALPKEEKITTTDVVVRDKPKNGTKFQKPTIADVQAYAVEKGYLVDASKFWHHYEANGWKVGKVAMKSWKAAVTNWSTNENSHRDRKQTAAARNQDLDDYLDAKIRAGLN